MEGNDEGVGNFLQNILFIVGMTFAHPLHFAFLLDYLHGINFPVDSFAHQSNFGVAAHSEDREKMKIL